MTVGPPRTTCARAPEVAPLPEELSGDRRVARLTSWAGGCCHPAAITRDSRALQLGRRARVAGHSGPAGEVGGAHPGAAPGGHSAPLGFGPGVGPQGWGSRGPRAVPRRPQRPGPLRPALAPSVPLNPSPLEMRSCPEYDAVLLSQLPRRASVSPAERSCRLEPGIAKGPRRGVVLPSAGRGGKGL